MIEKTVRDYLAERLADAVGLEAPNPKPDRYTVIEKTGSDEDNGLKIADLAIQSVAPTLYEAATMNETLTAEMRGLTSLTNIFRVEVETDYNHTDTSTKERRYQAVFHVFYKEDN